VEAGVVCRRAIVDLPVEECFLAEAVLLSSGVEVIHPILLGQGVVSHSQKVVQKVPMRVDRPWSHTGVEGCHLLACVVLQEVVVGLLGPDHEWISCRRMSREDLGEILLTVDTVVAVEV